MYATKETVPAITFMCGLIFGSDLFPKSFKTCKGMYIIASPQGKKLSLTLNHFWGCFEVLLQQNKEREITEHLIWFLRREKLLSFQLWQVFHRQVAPHAVVMWYVLIFKSWRVNFILRLSDPEIHATKHADKFIEINKVQVHLVEFCRGAYNFCPECWRLHLRMQNFKVLSGEKGRGQGTYHGGTLGLQM